MRLGAKREFWRALNRAPLERFRDDEPGQHEGIAPANIAWEVWVACTVGGEGFNVRTLHELQTTIDYDGLKDILESQQVYRSWQIAARKNAEEKAERDRRRR